MIPFCDLEVGSSKDAELMVKGCQEFLRLRPQNSLSWWERACGFRFMELRFECRRANSVRHRTVPSKVARGVSFRRRAIARNHRYGTRGGPTRDSYGNPRHQYAADNIDEVVPLQQQDRDNQQTVIGAQNNQHSLPAAQEPHHDEWLGNMHARKGDAVVGGNAMDRDMIPKRKRARDKQFLEGVGLKSGGKPREMPGHK